MGEPISNGQIKGLRRGKREKTHFGGGGQLGQRQRRMKPERVNALRANGGKRNPESVRGPKGSLRPKGVFFIVYFRILSCGEDGEVILKRGRR